ncbi:MAG: UDP-N-acetylmuramate dehydrogenase [Synergistaceae bacterium]|jgi:UDP-N-acetylmuramate dehydrogenase|nr:UDP-N-acetylmuramate dehydrogenase [Synergistaceae bacterium]
MPQQSAPERLEKIIRRDAPLAGFTTWGVGGTAKTLLSPADRGELSISLGWLRSRGLDYYVVGGGSNSLVFDGEIDVPIISTRLMDTVTFSREGGSITLTCGAGALLKDVFALSVREGWSGLEFTAGIPGSVGGAIMGNAGTREGEISSAVRRIEMADRTGSLFTLDRGGIGWGYRRCSLAEDGIAVISSVVMELRESTPEAVAKSVRVTLERRKSQPLSARTAGCVFKNPEGDSAGRLLEEAGCKDLSVGGARVSEIHANFIENYADCTAMDIARLAKLCRDKVYEKFGVALSFEIKFVGWRGDFMEV